MVNTSGSIRIWWDVSIQAYRISTPYNKSFLDAMKALIPFSDRNWDDTTKVWTVTERFMEPMKQLAEKYYRATAVVITRQQAEAAQQSAPVAKIASVDEVILKFFKLLPYDSARKAYLHGANALHPDHGGEMSKMSDFNAAWQRLEQELYGKS